LPQKLTGRTACWHEKLQDYNFKILHISGKNNTPADVLSQPSDNEWEVGDKQLLLIPREVFLNIVDADIVNSLEALIVSSQCQHGLWLMGRKERSSLEEKWGLWVDTNNKVVVLPD